MMNSQALSGISVLDISECISGPYCAKLLGEFGADVIKVEKPGCGDRARQWKGDFDDGQRLEKSPLFLYLNTNKKSITLDLKTDDGRALFYRLIDGVDIMVENRMPGTLDRLGIGYEALKKNNPGLILVSITDFGQTGIYKDYKGGRLVGYAMGGYLYVNGEPHREPLAGAGEQASYQGGINGYIGALSALLKREKTKSGDHIDVSLMESMAAIHQYTLNRYAFSGKIQKRSGNRHMWAHPVTIYPCIDGYVAISAVTDDQCERLLLMMEKQYLLTDERFIRGDSRLANADAFDLLLLPWFKKRTRREIAESCAEWRIPAASVNSMEDLLNDPQYKAREFFSFIDHPVMGRLPYPSAPFKMSKTPAQCRRAPLLGEHNQSIYIERLGLAENEFELLVRKGVI